MDRTSIVRWAQDSVANIQKNGLSGVDDSLRPAYYKLLHQVSRFSTDSNNVFDFDWDLLLVIDACRYDLFANTAAEYDWLNTVSSITSVDTMTPEWMRNTFTEDVAEEMANTSYICGNPFSAKILDKRDFYYLDEVWRYQWDSEFGTMYPRALTDRTIQHLRENDPDRAIVHYMQPHWPFIPDPDLTAGQGLKIDDFGTYNKFDVWERLQRGELDRETVWDAYRRNLEFVLDDIETLVRNVRRDDIVITSDHGNAFGEWMVYGHPMHMPLECLRKVPWAKVNASYDGSYTPDPAHLTNDETGIEIDEQLQALGYVE